MEPQKKYVTPDVAVDMLSRNTDNRAIRPSTLKFFEDCLRSGHLVEGGLLVTTSQGTLKDGQHRLQSVINTGIPCWFTIAINDKKDIHRYLDQTGGRSAVDDYVIQCKHKKLKDEHPKLTCSIASCLVEIESRGKARTGRRTAADRAIQSQEQIMRYRDLALEIHGGILPPALNTAYIAAFLHQDRFDLAREFFEAIKKDKQSSRLTRVESLAVEINQEAKRMSAEQKFKGFKPNFWANRIFAEILFRTKT